MSTSLPRTDQYFIMYKVLLLLLLFPWGVGGVAQFVFVSCLVFVGRGVLVIFLLVAGRLAFIM